MKNYHLLLLLLVCIVASSCHEMTTEECQSKYSLVPGPCPPVTPSTCDLGAITTQPPDNTPQFYFKATEALALQLKTNYNPATGMLTGLTISKNTLNYLLCTMNADTVFFNFGKDATGNDTYVITSKDHAGNLAWIYHDPLASGGQVTCPPTCSKP